MTYLNKAMYTPLHRGKWLRPSQRPRPASRKVAKEELSDDDLACIALALGGLAVEQEELRREIEALRY